MYPRSIKKNWGTAEVVEKIVQELPNWRGPPLTVLLQPETIPPEGYDSEDSVSSKSDAPIGLCFSLQGCLRGYAGKSLPPDTQKTPKGKKLSAPSLGKITNR